MTFICYSTGLIEWIISSSTLRNTMEIGNHVGKILFGSKLILAKH